MLLTLLVLLQLAYCNVVVVDVDISVSENFPCMWFIYCYEMESGHLAIGNFNVYFHFLFCCFGFSTDLGRDVCSNSRDKSILRFELCGVSE